MYMHNTLIRAPLELLNLHQLKVLTSHLLVAIRRRVEMSITHKVSESSSLPLIYQIVFIKCVDDESIKMGFDIALRNVWHGASSLSADQYKPGGDLACPAVGPRDIVSSPSLRILKYKFRR